MYQLALQKLKHEIESRRTQLLTGKVGSMEQYREVLRTIRDLENLISELEAEARKQDDN